MLQTQTFTVDAALLQELGERLIGREHIALGELIKNSYDADASTCQINFTSDTIEIIDDGHGMSKRDFLKRWLRIGTVHKSEAAYSASLGRQLTGSKGVGRLAAQFLARELELWTKAAGSKELYAKVDWQDIKPGTEIKDFHVSYDEGTFETAYPFGSRTGMKLLLSGLKQAWNEEAFRDLGRELWMLRNPFRARKAARSPETKQADDFDVILKASEIEVAQEAFESTQRALLEDVWKARITGELKNGREGGTCKIRLEFKNGYPDGAKADEYRERVRLPLKASSKEGASPGESRPLIDRFKFDILIYKLEGRQAGSVRLEDLKDFIAEQGNVRIYDAGFRLPYYGPHQDWLDIVSDQAARITKSSLLPQRLQIDERYLLELPQPRRRILGAVEISTGHERQVSDKSSYLEINPGRDRLQSNAAFDQLRDIVRFALDFYANRYAYRKFSQAELKSKSKRGPAAAQERAADAFARLRESLPQGTLPKRALDEIERRLKEATVATDAAEKALNARAALLAPLATAGMSALALQHELGREVRGLKSIARNLLAGKGVDAQRLKTQAEGLQLAVGRIEALMRLFSPLLNEEDREKVDSYRALPLVRDVTSALAPIMPGLTVNFDIDRELRLPKGAYASWFSLMQNIVSNAWNATLEADERKLCVVGEVAKRGGRLVFSDTGVGLSVPLEKAGQLFEPFNRMLKIGSERSSLMIGGHGLGLAIVRMLAEDHKSKARFIKPIDGFNTSLEISW